ncbi:MAG: ADP-glyceromanno-heptose 6-epimerase [Planctomycetes bacterium]|nr:ADP-glyceromanno-heptose 6-epimerase [Planctomycetota bacterium]
MYIVTGGAGFIGSAMVWKLNRMGIDAIWIVDDLSDDGKWKNLSGLKFREIIGISEFLENLRQDDGLPDGTEAVIHMGACSSTTETDADYLLSNNFEYSRLVTEYALQAGARILSASSAATYGDGKHGYLDDADNLYNLRPLNMYGFSKLLYDQWAYRSGHLDRIASLRFFNVYGPNEYHKGDMASMVFKSCRIAEQTGTIKLFKSHRPDYRDGEQQRDFVYIKDVVDAMWWLVEHPDANGLFNIGTGEAESWNQLANAVFAALGKEPHIEYIDMPESIRGQYQYHTKADITRLRQAGYEGNFRLIADGVADYVKNHLLADDMHINNQD